MWQINPFSSSSHVPFKKASRKTNQQDLCSFVISCVKRCEEMLAFHMLQVENKRK